MNLILAGHNHGGINSKYVDRLRDEAKTLGVNATILLDDDANIVQQLSTADIIWHGMSMIHHVISLYP